MKSKRNQINYSVRKLLKPKLDGHTTFYNFMNSVYLKYCSLVGSLHLLPDFYIIGGQKCATTSLYLYLIQHPLIKKPIKKDIRFFDKYYEKGTNWYRVFFPYKFQKQISKKIFNKDFITCEATERYLEYPHTPSRIKKLTPNAKFIVLLRNPVSRAYSHYNMIVGHGHEELSFDNAIKHETERITHEFKKMEKDQKYYSDSYFQYSYLDRGIYVDKLKRWMEVFPKEQFLILQTEEFQQNTSKVYNQVLKFLGLPQWELEEYTQFKKRVYKKPMVEPSVRKQLIEYFKPHNQRLYDFLGKKFDWDE